MAVFLILLLGFTATLLRADSKFEDSPGTENIWFIKLSELRKGDDFYLAQIRGRAIIVVLWTPETELSRYVLLDLQKVHNYLKREKKFITVISIAPANRCKQALETLNSLRICYPCYLASQEQLSLLGQQVYPYVLHFNPYGEQVWKLVGFRKDMTKDVIELLENNL